MKSKVKGNEKVKKQNGGYGKSSIDLSLILPHQKIQGRCRSSLKYLSYDASFSSRILF